MTASPAASHTVFDPLLPAADVAAMVRICARLGSYEMYSEEPTFAGVGQGLPARWDDEVITRYRWRDLRFSVSWKAYRFADEAERRASRRSLRPRLRARADARRTRSL